ncbi:hypothetical protein A2V82_06305 [candidate division KSB1 bacterium RBG_16_48_16]|nr:MAG: hypothetical protein A2V82_06305 [candidate division KSB1 bacterium RBG_16_48_16]
MRAYMLIIIVALLITGIAVVPLYAQSKLYEGPDDPAGDPAAEREAHMDGNRFQIYFNNGGYTGSWGYLDGSKWPRTSEQGLDMYDTCNLIVGSKVYLKNDSIPETDADRIANGTDLSVLYIIESNSESETAPDGTTSWAFTPVFGYFNDLAESPAISTDSFSWPTAGWPARGDELKWPGEWNGRFGRGVQYAQFELYSVMNDAQDQEWLQPSQPVKYHPRRRYDDNNNIVEDVLIGDKRPQVTTQRGLPWGGLGVRVETRGYQWDNPQTRDIVFWEYNIANISEYDLPEVVFGFYMDLGLGHYILRSDGEDDVGSFNKSLDLSFCWDTNGKGNFDYPVGTLGFAFLESPGIPNDGADNDNDGLVDEKRDNFATTKIGPTDGIVDLEKFMAFYGYESVDDLKEHWDADEDQDWNDGTDLNGNGIYDSGENAGDDVGLDGVGPGELNYYGPDIDGTECNHKPDLLEGIGAEPNFGLTDISESDMLGLQSFHLFTHPQQNSPQTRWDRECYRILSDQVLNQSFGTATNLYQAFGTGPFRLDKGRTERISMATIAAYEDLSTLNNDKTAPIIFERKKVVQTIYESDYRFAKPPLLPTLKAFAGNGRVILTWDDMSDRFSREPLEGGANDFEGYKLYKATDRFFQDALLLRDGFGNPAGLKPYKQWDLKNDYYGHTDFALVEGEGFYLGSNSGIQHYYIDTNVQNGRTYYYYLAAYDHGIRSKDIAPSENVPSIAVDEKENITFLSQNVQIVTPRSPAAGFSSPTVEILNDPDEIPGALDSFAVNIIDPGSIKGNLVYKMTFNVDTVRTLGTRPPATALWGHQFVNSAFKIMDALTDSVVYEETKDNYVLNHITRFDTAGASYGSNLGWDLIVPQQLIQTDIFDGIQVEFMLDLPESGIAAYDSINTGWYEGGGGMNVTIYGDYLSYFAFPLDLIFTGEDESYTTRLTRATRVPTGTGLVIRSEQYLLGQSFHFYVEDKSHKEADGQYLKLDMVAIDMDSNFVFDLNQDEIFVGHVDYDSLRDRYTWLYSLFSFNFRDVPASSMPQPGSVYRINFHTPFQATDTLMFRIPEYDLTSGPMVDEDMDKISVVPNPYVVTNTLEPGVRNINLNQRRRIMFTNIPAQCTIKIFTMSGYLVDEIEVDGYQDAGMAYWDLLTKEDLEIAAGVYLYHIKSKVSGKEKMGKFAVIK